MDALDLHPSGYSGTYKLIGGRASLDFVNTISWPGTDREHDWFSSIENVRIWAAASGLWGQYLTAADMPHIRDTRSCIADALRRLADDATERAGAISPLNTMLREAAGRRAIDPVTLTWSWVDQARVEALLDPILIDAAELITTKARQRLSQCPACQWLFEDQTRNGRRRWCDMADCGSRAKSRAHYYRSKA